MDVPDLGSYFFRRSERVPKGAKEMESAMVDVLLWGGLSTLIVGLAIIAARKPTP